MVVTGALGLALASEQSAERSTGGGPSTPHGEPTPSILTLAAGGQRASFDKGSVFFVGTATVIIRYGGFTILTDPNFLHKGEHAHLGYGLTSERLTDPAIGMEQLPPIDFVLLSHFHGDHFDQRVQERLDKGLPIVTTPSAVAELEKIGFSAGHPLNPWETLTVVKGAGKVRITSMPGRHGPPIVAKALPPVMGSMLEFQDGPGSTRYRLYVSGDTLVYEDIEEIPKRYKDIDLALLHLGGTRVSGVLVTMDAAQAVQMLRIVAPQTAIPIHYDDYTVFKSPLAEFAASARAADFEHRIRYLKPGETYHFDAAK